MFKLFFFGCIALCAAVDWCDPVLCNGEKNKHLGCIRDGSFGKKCPPGAELIKLDTKAFLHRINSLRNKLALGQVEGYEPAARMATMQWDDESAYLAELNVKSCEFAHDGCYSTFKYKNPGQCLALAMGGDLSAQKVDMRYIVEMAADGWFNEYKNMNMDYINHFRMDSNFGRYGHFAVMAVANITHVGCGASYFRQKPKAENTEDRIQVACHFNNIFYEVAPLYDSGAPASKCLTGKNPDYPGLCSLKEKLNPNHEGF